MKVEPFGSAFSCKRYVCPNEAKKICLKEMLRHGLSEGGFRFAWYKKNDLCGYCSGEDEMLISLSLPIVVGASHETVLEIILHEVAHGIDYLENNGWRTRSKYFGQKKVEVSLAHDLNWRKIAKSIGLDRPRSFINV